MCNRTPFPHPLGSIVGGESLGAEVGVGRCVVRLRFRLDAHATLFGVDGLWMTRKYILRIATVYFVCLIQRSRRPCLGWRDPGQVTFVRFPRLDVRNTRYLGGRRHGSGIAAKCNNVQIFYIAFYLSSV